MKQIDRFCWDILTSVEKKEGDITYPNPENYKFLYKTQHFQKAETNFLTDFWKSTCIVWLYL